MFKIGSKFVCGFVEKLHQILIITFKEYKWLK